ncbi:hypothetical protein [Afipia felis]
MSIVFPRFAANAIVDLAKYWGAAQATTERRQDKKPTSGLGRSVVLFLIFPFFCTSRIIIAMCVSSISRMISTYIAHRGHDHETR